MDRDFNRAHDYVVLEFLRDNLRLRAIIAALLQAQQLSRSKSIQRSSLMKTMVVWSLKPGASLSEAVSRFLAGQAGPEPGSTILGRWHSVDLSIGFTLVESDNPAPAHYANAAKWGDILDIRTYIVVEDGEAGAILASVFKK
jgi:hypothetical protein